jgi:hypothetical protein
VLLRVPLLKLSMIVCLFFPFLEALVSLSLPGLFVEFLDFSSFSRVFEGGFSYWATYNGLLVPYVFWAFKDFGFTQLKFHWTICYKVNRYFFRSNAKLFKGGLELFFK